jgi:hypothetical protein
MSLLEMSSMDESMNQEGFLALQSGEDVNGAQ